MTAELSPDDVIAFWRDAGPRKWFTADPAFDVQIKDRFEALHHSAARRERDRWAETAKGSLALLLLLDQFPRNMYRGTAHAFATDGLARRFARDAIEAAFDRTTPTALRVFFYLPFEHSEAVADQDLCVELVRGWISDGGDADQMKWVDIHRDIILRFGRFPHRNPALGRATSPEEQAFLDGGGFSG
jgi:uncharacterized protein (DUF924 family)